MTQKMEKMAEFLEAEHTLTEKKLSELEGIIVDLSYEGKASLGKNLKKLKEVIEFFKHQFLEHIEFEEKDLFPFLRAHIPKLEMLLNLLASEHRDFKERLENFEFYAEMIAQTDSAIKRSEIIGKIRQTGVYLISLLRNHVKMEKTNLYKAMTQDLTANERNEIKTLAKHDILKTNLEQKNKRRLA